MNKIDFGEFVWFSQKPRVAQLAVTIPSPNTLNLNGKLMEQMPVCIVIGATPDGKTLCIREQISEGYKLPKSGRVKDSELIAFLINAGIRLPARYSVTKEDSCWIAVLDAFTPPKVDMTRKRAPRKVGSKALEALRKEVESL